MFDSYKTYSAYSTTELLKIIGQPTLYQRAAVEAAERLLSERNIQEHERIQALKELAVEVYTAHQPHLLDKVRATINSSLLYLFTPSTAFDVRKWNYWLCIGLAMYSVLAMTNNVQFLLFVLRCRGCTFMSSN